DVDVLRQDLAVGGHEQNVIERERFAEIVVEHGGVFQQGAAYVNRRRSPSARPAAAVGRSMSLDRALRCQAALATFLTTSRSWRKRDLAAWLVDTYGAEPEPAPAPRAAAAP